MPISSRSRAAETWRLEDDIVGPLLQSAHLGKKRTFRKGEVLYSQGTVDSKFYFILDGRVQISALREDGTEFILEVMGHWAVCGEGAAFDRKPRFTSAVAIEETQTVEFDVNGFEEVFRQRPELAIALLRITALKQRILAVRAQYLASPKPEQRICELLSRLGDLYGVDEGKVKVFTITLTHEQIAAMTGASRVTVTRTLKRLKDEGVIGIRGKQFQIFDTARLLQ